MIQLSEGVIESLVNRVSFKVMEIIRDEQRLKPDDITQTAFGRLMCNEFSILKQKVDSIDPKSNSTLDLTLRAEVALLKERINALNSQLKNLSENPETLLRLSIDRFTLTKE